MSLQIAAKHLAAHGRGPDTTLVHMTPGEVASLQSLAQQHGGSLSINPQTGLPEAGFLSALLPMAAGAGLAAMGMPQGYAALAVGATSALTNGGNMKKSVLDGISAYGGAGMADAFMGAGLGTMGGTMGTSAAEAAPTVLAPPPGGASVYSLGSSAAPSTTGYSLGESSSFLNQPLPTLASAAPAEVAKQAATLTPAAQAAKQAAALNELTMGQRFDALKAGATGTNAMNYIKANPFTSLGVATAAMTPDETSTPQKTTDTDLGPRAKLQYYPGYGTSLPKPNMQGIEQTYNRPYYAAEGGVTSMAEGGVTSAPRNQQQLFADYLARVSGGAGTGTGIEVAPKPGTGVETETPEKPDLPFLETPVASNTQGGGGGGMDAEGREARQKEINERMDKLQASMTPEQWASRNDWIGNMFNNSTLGAVTNIAKKGINAVQTYYRENELKDIYAKEAEAEAARKRQELIGEIQLGNQSIYGPQTVGRTAPVTPASEQVQQAIANTNFAGMDRNNFGVAESNAAANRAYGNAPEGRTGRDATAGDGNDRNQYGSVAAGYTGGSEAADGGLSTPYGFQHMAQGGISDPYDLGSYSDGGRLLKGPGDGVSDSIPATIGKGRPARLADGEFVIPARIVSEIGNGSTDAGARKLYAMMDRIQAGRKKSVGKNKVAVNSRADKHLPA